MGWTNFGITGSSEEMQTPHFPYLLCNPCGLMCFQWALLEFLAHVMRYLLDIVLELRRGMILAVTCLIINSSICRACRDDAVFASGELVPLVGPGFSRCFFSHWSVPRHHLHTALHCMPDRGGYWYQCMEFEVFTFINIILKCNILLNLFIITYRNL